jgi:hypothetical protein
MRVGPTMPIEPMTPSSVEYLAATTEAPVEVPSSVSLPMKIWT